MKHLIFLLFALPALAGSLDEELYCGPPKRDTSGTIVRSYSVLSAYQRIHPCPSTGLKSGACPGWAKNHNRPLACGGCDSVSNISWMRTDVKKLVDGYERKIGALDPPVQDTGACVNQIVP